MKRLIFSLLIIIMVVSLGKAQVPKQVFDTFGSMYKEAESIEWFKDGGDHQVYFEYNGVSKTASFRNNGSWIKTVTDIPLSELLPCINDYLEEVYPTATPVVAEFLETPDVERYHVVLESEEVGFTEDDQEEVTINSLTLIFDANCELFDND